MSNIEVERVFLLKNLPEDLLEYKHIDIKIGDFTQDNDVDILKIRQKGDKFELIKKEVITDLERKEYVIPLTKSEFDLLFPVTIRKHTKKRFFYPLDKYTCEIDLYLEDMSGYARAEVEFKDAEEADDFVPPAWFGDEITSINHVIHEGLGEISFKIMKDRYEKRDMDLKNIEISK
jgi:adenylate cyclase